MSQDFAKKDRAAPRKKSGTGSIPGWVWLATGVVTGAFIMFLVYLSGITPQKMADKKPIAKDNLPPVEEHSEKPTFEFSDRLMNNEVIDTKNPKPSGSASTTNSPVSYILQAAAFQKPQDADALKAKLILEGLDTNIQPFNKNGENWYRVLVGPFTNPAKMAQAKATLAQHNINPIVLQKSAPLKPGT